MWKRFRPSISTTSIPIARETIPPKKMGKSQKPISIVEAPLSEKEMTTLPSPQSDDTSIGIGNETMKVRLQL